MTLVLEVVREVYGKEDIIGGMTVGELRRFLKWYDDDTKIVLSHDNGYTYGAIREENFEEDWEDEE